MLLVLLALTVSLLVGNSWQLWKHYATRILYTLVHRLSRLCKKVGATLAPEVTSPAADTPVFQYRTPEACEPKKNVGGIVFKMNGHHTWDDLEISYSGEFKIAMSGQQASGNQDVMNNNSVSKSD